MNAEFPTVTDEDRRKHLDYIQAVITRMSAASSGAKGWLLPVVTLTYGYALTQKEDSVALLGVASVVLFMILDAHYLSQEQAYRRLYSTVARGTAEVPAYSLDPSEALDTANQKSTSCAAWRLVRSWLPGWKPLGSWSIAPFYGPLIVIGALIIGVGGSKCPIG